MLELAEQKKLSELNLRRAEAQALYLQTLLNMAQKKYDAEYQLYDRAKTKAAARPLIYSGKEEKVAKKIPFPFPIDPQGRVLLNVKLDDEAWKEIRKMTPGGDKKEFEDIKVFKTQFTSYLSHPVEETTSVSLDLQTKHDEKLHPVFEEQLKKYLPKDRKEINDKIIGAFQKYVPKSRIINLQEEINSHAGIVGEMIIASLNKEEQLPREESEKRAGEVRQGVDKALLTLNQRVLQLQAKALEEAYHAAIIDPNKNPPINPEKFALTLNKKLDEARLTLLPEIAKEVREGVVTTRKKPFTKNVVKHLSKHLAEATTATPNDYVHLDKGTGMISFIGGSKNTSHHQRLGNDHLADRIMYSHYYNDRDKKVEALSDRQQVRIPAIAIKKIHPKTKEFIEKAKDELQKGVSVALTEKQIKSVKSEEDKEQVKDEFEKLVKIIQEKTDPKKSMKERTKVAFDMLIVQDTAEKITYLQDRYGLGVAEDKSEKSNSNQAFIYNLYTTLNKENNLLEIIDERNNKQSQSAAHILEGAHKYNRDNRDMPMCLVQNIAVNGWGHELSTKKGVPLLVKEATLMTKMASLHTFYDSLDEDSKRNVEKLFESYKDFLKTNSNSFYDYLETNKLLENQAFKVKIDPNFSQTILDKEDLSVAQGHKNFVNNTKLALINLYNNDAFGSRDYGFAYQALSVFSEKSSMGGCKSANERAQGVNGRVAILDFMSLGKEIREGLLNHYLERPESTRLIDIVNELEASIKKAAEIERDANLKSDPKAYEDASKANIALINKHLNNLYEALNIEGFQAAVSRFDQGSHSKLASQGGLLPNTNNSEQVQVSVEGASKMQSHKGLSEYVLKEFCGVEKVKYVKEFTKMLQRGVGGGLAGGVAIGALGALGVAAPVVPVVVGLAAVAAGFSAAGTLIKKIGKKSREERYIEESMKKDIALIAKLEKEVAPIIIKQEPKTPPPAGSVYTSRSENNPNSKQSPNEVNGKKSSEEGIKGRLDQMKPKAQPVDNQSTVQEPHDNHSQTKYGN